MKENRVRENEKTLLKGKDNKQTLFKKKTDNDDWDRIQFILLLVGSKAKFLWEFDGWEARGNQPRIELRLNLADSTVRKWDQIFNLVLHTNSGVWDSNIETSSDQLT